MGSLFSCLEISKGLGAEGAASFWIDGSQRGTEVLILGTGKEDQEGIFSARYFLMLEKPSDTGSVISCPHHSWPRDVQCLFALLCFAWLCSPLSKPYMSTLFHHSSFACGTLSSVPFLWACSKLCFRLWGLIPHCYETRQSLWCTGIGRSSKLGFLPARLFKIH